MSPQLIYTGTFWWLILNLWSWQSKVFENWHHLLVHLYGYSILHLNISYTVCVPYWVIHRCLQDIIQLCLFLSAFLFSSKKESTKPSTCLPSLFKPRCCVHQDALLKNHSYQETGKARKKRKKLEKPEQTDVWPCSARIFTSIAIGFCDNNRWTLIFFLH